MENLNKKNSAENLNVNSQTNANASKNNLFSADGDERIKLVVYNNHTLGFINPKYPSLVQVLHSSVLKGAVGTTIMSSYQIGSTDVIRLANAQDFEDFRCHFGSFENEEEYIYQK